MGFLASGVLPSIEWQGAYLFILYNILLYLPWHGPLCAMAIDRNVRQANLFNSHVLLYVCPSTPHTDSLKLVKNKLSDWHGKLILHFMQFGSPYWSSTHDKLFKHSTESQVAVKEKPKSSI